MADVTDTIRQIAFSFGISEVHAAQVYERAEREHETFLTAYREIGHDEDGCCPLCGHFDD